MFNTCCPPTSNLSPTSRAELLRGPLYYVLILAAVTVLYWRESAAGLLVIALMCGGDGLADIVGRRFGSAKLPHNGNKSWAGSAAMFLGARACRPGTTCRIPPYTFYIIHSVQKRPVFLQWTKSPHLLGVDLRLGEASFLQGSFESEIVSVAPPLPRAGSLGTATAYMALFAQLGFVAPDVRSAVPTMAAISAAATIAESLPVNQWVDDNLSVPAVAAVLGHLLLHGV